MKRNIVKKKAKVVAVDDSNKMEISIMFTTKKCNLTRGEMRKVAVQAAEKVADAIRDLSYVHYGPSNTTVSL